MLYISSLSSQEHFSGRVLTVRVEANDAVRAERGWVFTTGNYAVIIDMVRYLFLFFIPYTIWYCVE